MFTDANRAPYEPSHLDVHCLYKYLYWSVGMKGLTSGSMKLSILQVVRFYPAWVHYVFCMMKMAILLMDKDFHHENTVI